MKLMNRDRLWTSRRSLITSSTAILGTAVVAVAAWLLRVPVVETWYLHQLETGNESERIEAAAWLAELRSARAVPVLVRELRRVAELESHADWRNHYVCTSLREIGAKAAPALIAVVRDTTEAFDVRKLASSAIGSTRETARRAVPELVSALADDDESTRVLACRAVGRFRQHASMAALAIEQLLSDERRHLRSTAALTLVRIGEGGARAVPALCEHLDEEEFFVAPGKVVKLPGLSQTAARALGELGRAALSAEPVLARVLRDRQRDDDVRRAVAEALADLGGDARDGIKALIEVLGDEHDDFEVRETVALALGDVGCRSREAIAALQKALMDQDPDVRAAASTGLARCDR